MTWVLTILFFLANGSPVVAAKAFPSVSECEKIEGEALTSANADDGVTGWLIVDECRPMGGKATKG